MPPREYPRVGTPVPSIRTLVFAPEVPEELNPHCLIRHPWFVKITPFREPVVKIARLHIETLPVNFITEVADA